MHVGTCKDLTRPAPDDVLTGSFTFVRGKRLKYIAIPGCVFALKTWKAFYLGHSVLTARTVNLETMTRPFMTLWLILPMFCD